MNYANDALGVAFAARERKMPVVISFTVETDGRLPDGELLSQAIPRLDPASGGYPCYYLLNCAYPTHFIAELQAGADWLTRLRGIRANALAKSHAELDAADALGGGDPQKLARQYQRLAELLPHLRVVGGCCGTATRHIRALSNVFH